MLSGAHNILWTRMPRDDRAMTTDPNSAVKAGTLLDEVLGPHNIPQTNSGWFFLSI